MAVLDMYPEWPDEDLWVFGYGSLMWRPDFDFDESAPARIYGFSRDLCLWSVEHRGTSDKPGLVFGLAGGGSCCGRAFRVRPGNREAVLDYLWQREMVRRAYIPTLVRIHMDGAVRPGLAFVVDSRHPQYVRNLDDKEIASILEQGRGQSGHNRDYFLDCLKKLEEMSICVRRYDKIRRHLVCDTRSVSENRSRSEGKPF